MEQTFFRNQQSLNQSNLSPFSLNLNVRYSAVFKAVNFLTAVVCISCEKSTCCVKTTFDMHFL